MEHYHRDCTLYFKRGKSTGRGTVVSKRFCFEHNVEVCKNDKCYWEVGWHYGIQNQFAKPSLVQGKHIFQLSLTGQFLKEHVSISSAAKSAGISTGLIWKQLRGKVEHAGGFTWILKHN